MIRTKSRGQAACIILMLAVILSYGKPVAAKTSFINMCNYYKLSSGRCVAHVIEYIVGDGGCSLTYSADGGVQFQGLWCNHCGVGLMSCGVCRTINKYAGGCNANNMYYECSEVYQDISAFSSDFSDISEWWYFNSTSGNGQRYKCLDVYKSNSNKTVQHRSYDYHTIDPAGRSDCLSEEAFQAINNTVCDQQTKAFNTGIYTVHNDPSSTYKCKDDDGNNLDDSTGEDCFITILPRPQGNLGAPDNDQSNSCSANALEVNKVNMNLYMNYTPVSYDSPVGPSLDINLSYNSESDITQTGSFGQKWIMSYESYIDEDEYGNVTVTMPDGRKDSYIPDGQGGYKRPPGGFYTLNKLTNNSYTLELSNGSSFVYGIHSTKKASITFLGAVRDAYAQQMTFSYNSDDRLETITDALGKATRFTYNAEGKVDRIEDPRGRSAGFTYDDNGDLSGITDTGGYNTEFTYDSNNYINSVSDDSGTWHYDIEPADGTSGDHDAYPAPGQPMGEAYRITISDPMGNREEYFYQGDNSWHVGRKDYQVYIDQDNNNYRNAQKTYYSADRTNPEASISKIQYPGGGSTKIESFDIVTGKPAVISDYHGEDSSGASVKHSIHLTYNPDGKVTSVTDAKGTITAVNYHPNNTDIQAVSNGLGTESYTYDNAHNITSVTDRLGNVTSVEYNLYGQIAAIAEAPGTPAQRTTEFLYDAEHNLKEIALNGNTIMSYTHDDAGRVKTYTDEAGKTIAYDYDDLNRITQINYPDGKFEAFSYSPCCRNLLQSRTDRAGLTTTYNYDALKRLISVQSPEGIVRYEYDAEGNIIKLTDAGGKATSFEYDYGNQSIRKLYADGTVVTYKYDPAGLLKEIINSRGISKKYSYDANHNLLTVSYSDSTNNISFTYDDYDRMRTRNDGTGVSQFSYDAGNRLTALNGPWENDTVSFTYNELGHLRDIIPQNGQPVSYSYDTLGRLADIRTDGTAFTYGYEGMNRLVSKLARSNGGVTEYSYNNPLKRLTGIINKDANGALVNRHDFTYNDLDLIERETVINEMPLPSLPGGTTSYNYNVLNQLISSTTPDRVYAYDADGNMVQGYTPDGYIMNMTYDAENRLTSAEYTDNKLVTHRIEYSYSGNSFLAEVKKYENDVLASDTHIIRDGALVLQERDETEHVLREYTWGTDMGGGIGGLLAMSQDGSNYYYLYDGKGNISAVMDTSQNIVNSYRYDEFGNPVAKTETLPQPFMFSTKQYDDATGLYYYGYRFYSPAMGRWLTRDPLGEDGGMNLYEFAGNNPVNYIDPLGLYSLDEFLQDSANFSSGFGDTITFGGTTWVRQQMGTDDVVNKCSGFYTSGKLTGYAWEAGTAWTGGLYGGAKSVFWSGSGAMAKAAKYGTNIEKTPIGHVLKMVGEKVPYPIMNIPWKVAAATFAGNAKKSAIKVGAAEGEVWSIIEKPILTWKTIPINYIP